MCSLILIWPCTAVFDRMTDTREALEVRRIKAKEILIFSRFNNKP